MRLSSKEDTYLRWTITSYEAGASSASYQSLSAAVSRAARKANARVIQEIADGDSSAGDCAIFILGFSDRSLQGLAKYLEIMQVVVPWSRSLGADCGADTERAILGIHSRPGRFGNLQH